MLLFIKVVVVNLFLSEHDYYRCNLKSLIAYYDFDSIMMLYQPIIGAKAASLYMSLVFEANYQEWVEVNTHAQLSKKTMLSLLEIQDAKKQLESIGLIKSYRKENENSLASYIYEIYAPKTPEAFFKDPVFYGLLEASLGEKEVSRIRHIYKMNKVDLKGYYDISASFSDVHENVSIKLNENKDLLLGKSAANIKANFDAFKFSDYLTNRYSILKSNITPEFIKEISRIALLFSYNEEVMASIASESYFPSSEPCFDLERIYQNCKESLIAPVSNNANDKGYKVYSSDDLLSKKVNMLNDTAPIEYFKLRSSNTYPSPADINIINILSRDYSLSNGVINVIIDYTLDACNQDFPKAYCEKLAAKLKRLHVTNAMEAINALTKRKVKETKKQKEEKVDDEISDEDLTSLMESL